MSTHMGTYAHPLATKAWKVDDGEGSHIVWANHGMQAKRLGADGLGVTFEEVECERYPELDGFHGDLLGWMRERGWHFECARCTQLVYGEDGVRDEHDNIFCSIEHQRAHDIEWRERRELKERFQAFAEVKYFGMQPSVSFVNVGGDALVLLRRPPTDERAVARFIERAELGA